MERSSESCLGRVVHFDDVDAIWEGAGAIFTREHSNGKFVIDEMLKDWFAETATGTGEGDFGDDRHGELVLDELVLVEFADGLLDVFRDACNLSS